MAPCVTFSHEQQTGATAMSDPTTVHTEANLRQIFANMDPDRAQTIRECYYEAVEALRCLAESLELADLEVPESHEHVLIYEHVIACEAIGAMNLSLLGKVL
jgi:hypothetical protein